MAMAAWIIGAGAAVGHYCGWPVSAPAVGDVKRGWKNARISEIKRISDWYCFPRGGQCRCGGEGPKVIIDNLYIRNAKVALSAGMLGGKKIPVPVPDIHLKDIGKDSKDGKGASLGEAAAKVMDAITGSVTKSASAINLDAIKKQTEGLTKGLDGATKGVTEGIKGLFGK